MRNAVQEESGLGTAHFVGEWLMETVDSKLARMPIGLGSGDQNVANTPRDWPHRRCSA